MIAFLELKLTFLGDIALASGWQPHHDDTYLRVLGLHADAISPARHVGYGFAVAQKTKSCDHESWKTARQPLRDELVRNGRWNGRNGCDRKSEVCSREASAGGVESTGIDNG